MNGIIKTIEWISDKLKVAGAACLVGMTFLTCVDVVGRFFRHPIFGSVEITGFMATAAVAAALPFTDMIDGHVGVEIVVRLLSHRTQALIELCTRVMRLGLVGLIAWRLALYAHSTQVAGEVSVILAFPEYTVIYMTSFCFLTLFMVVFLDVMHILKKLREK